MFIPVIVVYNLSGNDKSERGVQSVAPSTAELCHTTERERERESEEC